MPEVKLTLTLDSEDEAVLALRWRSTRIALDDICNYLREVDKYGRDVPEGLGDLQKFCEFVQTLRDKVYEIIASNGVAL